MVDEETETRLATTPEDLLAALKAEMGADGFQRQLDPAHSVTYLARGPKLLVTFEKLADTLSSSETGMPLGFDFVEDKNWSLLHVATNADTWYRSDAVYAFMDEMVDEAFFENFDQVAFYGVAMNGYAAAAFSVVAPGAAVIALCPQATMDVDRAGWDDRFPAARRLRFDTRYGYAPDMMEGAGKGYILYDPNEKMDAVHASLFQGPNVVHLPCRFFRRHIARSMREMGFLHQVIERAADQSLTAQEFHRLMRARRDHTRYLRNLLFHLDDAGKPWRTALLCKHVLARMSAPTFRRRMNAAVKSLKDAGTLPDWLQDV